MNDTTTDFNDEDHPDNGWDMACPTCGNDALDVAATIWVRLVPDGTDIDLAHNHDHEWDDSAACYCDHCQWAGTVKEAKQEE